MKANELYFSVFNAEVIGDSKLYNLITLCPIAYWHEHECLPDYFFGGELAEDLFSKEYHLYLFSEEMMYHCQKPIEDIKKELTELGFVHNVEMETFLIECHS